jgi:hypothetical protein
MIGIDGGRVNRDLMIPQQLLLKGLRKTSNTSIKMASTCQVHT